VDKYDPLALLMFEGFLEPPNLRVSSFLRMKYVPDIVSADEWMGLTWITNYLV